MTNDISPLRIQVDCSADIISAMSSQRDAWPSGSSSVSLRHSSLCSSRRTIRLIGRKAMLANLSFWIKSFVTSHGYFSRKTLTNYMCQPSECNKGRVPKPCVPDESLLLGMVEIDSSILHCGVANSVPFIREISMEFSYICLPKQVVDASQDNWEVIVLHFFQILRFKQKISNGAWSPVQFHMKKVPSCLKNKPKDRLANSLGRYQSEEHVLVASVCFKWPWRETLLEMTSCWGRHHSACSRSFLPWSDWAYAQELKNCKSTFTRWHKRNTELKSLSGVRDPTKRIKLGVGERFMCKQRKTSRLLSSAQFWSPITWSHVPPTFRKPINMPAHQFARHQSFN